MPRTKEQTNKMLMDKSLTNETLDKAFYDLENDPIYGKSGEYGLIKDVLNKYPQNNDEKIVAMKISLIDVTNSTHLSLHKQNINLAQLAKFICKDLNFDQRVKDGDQSLVNDLAKNIGCTNLFSFATKYCQYHNSIVYNKDDYAKYDHIVCDYLPMYAKMRNVKYNNRSVTSNTIKTLAKNLNNKAFNKIIDDILSEITTSNKKAKFDSLMWYYNRKSNKNTSKN